MRFPLWGYLHALLFSLIMVSGISGITTFVTTSIATMFVGPVETVVQPATVIAIPGLSSTVTNVGSPTPVLPPDPPSFFNTVPATTLVSTGTHFLTHSLTQITVTTSTSSKVPPLSSSAPGVSSSSGGTPILSSFQTSSTTSSTTVPVADHTPITTSDSVMAVGNPSNRSLIKGIAGGVGGVALLVGFICWYFKANRRKKTNCRKRRKGKIVAGLAPNGNKSGTPSLGIFAVSGGLHNQRKSSGSELENGIPLRNMGTTSAASNSIAETLSEYNARSPTPKSSRPANPRPNSPLTVVGTVSTFAPTFPISNNDETFWPQTPAATAAYAAQNKLNDAASSNPLNQPPRPGHHKVLATQLASRAPPTHLPHIQFEQSPVGLPARRILHPGRQNLPNGPESTYNDLTGSIEEGSKLLKPTGAHYTGILSPDIQYSVRNPYDNEARQGPAPKEDLDDIRQLPGRMSRRNLSPEPLKIVKRSPSHPENAPQTPIRPQKRMPVEMKEDSDESDDELRSEKRNAALKSLEGRSPHLTTDKALLKSGIDVHNPPPAPIKKGMGIGLGYLRRDSAGNLTLIKPMTPIKQPAFGRKTSSIYSRSSAGIAPPEMPDSAVFEDYKHYY